MDKLLKTARFKLHKLRRIRKFLTPAQAKLFSSLDFYKQKVDAESK